MNIMNSVLLFLSLTFSACCTVETMRHTIIFDSLNHTPQTSQSSVIDLDLFNMNGRLSLIVRAEKRSFTQKLCGSQIIEDEEEERLFSGVFAFDVEQQNLVGALKTDRWESVYEATTIDDNFILKINGTDFASTKKIPKGPFDLVNVINLDQGAIFLSQNRIEQPGGSSKGPVQFEMQRYGGKSWKILSSDQSIFDCDVARIDTPTPSPDGKLFYLHTEVRQCVPEGKLEHFHEIRIFDSTSGALLAGRRYEPIAEKVVAGTDGWFVGFRIQNDRSTAEMLGTWEESTHIGDLVLKSIWYLSNAAGDPVGTIVANDLLPFNGMWLAEFNGGFILYGPTGEVIRSKKLPFMPTKALSASNRVVMHGDSFYLISRNEIGVACIFGYDSSLKLQSRTCADAFDLESAIDNFVEGVQ